MPLQVLPANEADAERAAQIENDAYAGDPFCPFLAPGPFPELPFGQKNPRIEELTRSLRESPSVRWFKVVDTDITPSEDNQQMIGFAQWNINDGSHLPLEARRSYGPGTNLEACEALYGWLRAVRNERLEARKHIHLRLLHVDPKHQRRGAGRMLVMSGIEAFSKLGLPFFLESSVAGHSLYLSCGFRDIDIKVIDFTRWGKPANHVNYVMTLEL
ncbi:acyl-CoA N-acyltransferase [Xylaria sp. CBS 124048]|nr:acyl-CoA N-acyltransferase [Xylaria sp. CBS 124048]